MDIHNNNISPCIFINEPKNNIYKRNEQHENQPYKLILRSFKLINIKNASYSRHIKNKEEREERVRSMFKYSYLEV